MTAIPRAPTSSGAAGRRLWRALAAPRTAYQGLRGVYGGAA